MPRREQRPAAPARGTRGGRSCPTGPAAAHALTHSRVQMEEPGHRGHSRPCPARLQERTAGAREGRGGEGWRSGGAGGRPRCRSCRPVPCPPPQGHSGFATVWPVPRAPWPSSHRSVLWRVPCGAAGLVSLPAAVGGRPRRGGRSRALGLGCLKSRMDRCRDERGHLSRMQGRDGRPRLPGPGQR